MNDGHIYIVDDNRELLDVIGQYINDNGYKTSTAKNGQELRALMKNGSPDLVVLDIMMPGEDGLSICRFLRESSDVPIIFLTALADDTDRIIGLEIGADDYLVKPFNPRELLARIRSVLRRTQSLPPNKLIDLEAAKSVKFGDWTLDIRARVLIDSDETSFLLSTAEFKLLSVFLLHPNIELNREKLVDLARGREAQSFDRSIDTLVNRLRNKIEKDIKNPEYIKTVWGKGYIFIVDEVK